MHLRAIDGSGHADIRNHAAKAGFLQPRQAFRSRRRGHYGVAAALKRVADKRSDRRLVLDEQDGGRSQCRLVIHRPASFAAALVFSTATGMRIENGLPVPMALLRHLISPPCAPTSP